MKNECPICQRPLPRGASCPKCSRLASGGTRLTISSTIAPGAASGKSITLDLPMEFLKHYQLHESLGKGGMGEVFRATDLAAERDVAIKFCVIYNVPGVRERFEHEAKLMGKIQHPNVVGVLASGMVEKIPYLVMPLVRGESLRTLLQQRKTLSPDETLHLVDQVLDALDAAHNQGVIHRDLKPENILVSPDGHAMVLDLGVAKSWADGSAAEDSSQISGTPTYMPPEQFKGLPTGLAADLYAVGVMLFEMLAGHPPYTGGNAIAIMKEHCDAKIPRVTESVPTLEEAWDHLLAKALAKAPADRFGDAKAFRIALAKAHTGKFNISALPAARSLENRGLMAISKGGAATAIGVTLLAAMVTTCITSLYLGHIPLAVAALLFPSSIFLNEEPGRFKQLSADGFWRVAVYGTAAISAGVMLFRLFGGAEPEHMTNVMFWTLIVVHLAWFGGYHARDPEDQEGVNLHRRAHIGVMAATVFITSAYQAFWAAGLMALSGLLAVLGALRPPSKTRHLSIGEATTMILVPGLLTAEQVLAEVEAPAPVKPRPSVRATVLKQRPKPEQS